MRTLLLLLILTATSLGSEREECERLAPLYNAETEVVLWDKTRVDLLNDEFAIEVDYPRKWAEAVGQSLYYAAVTDLKPGIILLVSDEARERKYVYRCQTLCELYGIKLFLEKVE